MFNIVDNIYKGSCFITILVASLALLHYLPRLRAWFSAIKKQQHLINTVQNRIAVCIPARNESCVIEGLFNCLDKQTYPKDKFEVFVIVKDTLDKTVELCKDRGIKCYVVSEQKCKGDALDVCFKNLISRKTNPFDAYLIVDADCYMADDFIEEMNNGLASNKDVIQGKKVVKNYYYSKKKVPLSASCNGLIWTIIDELGNRYKSNNNITAMTIGTAIMLKKRVVEEIGGWPYKQTLTEDIEFMNDCALRGFSCYYNSYAIMYVEEALTLKMTNKRRKRWLCGVIDSKRLYAARLKDLPSTRENKRNRYYCFGLWPIFRYIGIITLFIIFHFVFGGILFFIGNQHYIYSLFCILFGFGMIYVSFLILTLWCIVVDRKYIPIPFWRKVVLLFVHPVFYMGYIPIIARALFLPNHFEWEAIERTNEASI